MTNSTIEELQSENQELRDLVVSLIAKLLRYLALDPPKYRRNVSHYGCRAPCGGSGAMLSLRENPKPEKRNC